MHYLSQSSLIAFIISQLQYHWWISFFFPFSDVDDHFKNTKQVFEELGIPNHTEEDCRIVQHVCCLISTRAAYLASAGNMIMFIAFNRNGTRETNLIIYQCFYADVQVCHLLNVHDLSESESLRLKESYFSLILNTKDCKPMNETVINFFVHRYCHFIEQDE